MMIFKVCFTLYLTKLYVGKGFWLYFASNLTLFLYEKTLAFAKHHEISLDA